MMTVTMTEAKRSPRMGMQGLKLLVLLLHHAAINTRSRAEAAMQGVIGAM
jgi:hypothetical protein